MPAPTAPVCPTNPAKLLTRLTGHSCAVNALAFTPDRRLLASGDRDGSGRIWDVASSAPGERATFRAPDGIRSVVFSPNGRVLAVGSASGSVILFDVSDKAAKEIRVLRGGVGAVDALAFSPDGKMVAAAGEDQVLRVWEPGAGTGSEARVLLPGHTRPIRAIAFAPDGQGIATAARDATARVWVLSRIRSRQRAALTHADGVDGVAYSSDGRTLATACRDGAIRLWDPTAVTPASRSEMVGHTGGARLVLITPEGDTLVGVSGSGPVFNWDSRTGRALRAWELPAASVSSVALTPDGRYMAQATADGAVAVYRVAEKRAQGT